MALTLENITIRLGERAALDGVSTRLEPGRITVVLGPNGAGKSTLLRVAAGLIPTPGVSLDGVAVAALSARERAQRIGYLPQDHVVEWNVTARELVALGRLPYRSPFTGESDTDRAAIDRALAATDALALSSRRMLTLSGGERARVLLARVLAGEPAWVLADEPLASLDPVHQLDLLDRLRGAADAGAGVVLVLHDLAQAARVADDVIVLDRGRVATNVLDPATIADIFGIAANWVDIAGQQRLVTLGRA